MKKNIIKLLAILTMCFMVVGVLASCGKEETPAADENNNQNQETATPELYIKDGTYWVGDFNTGLSAEEGRDELCPSHDDPEHEWHHVCTIQEHDADGTTDIVLYACLDCNYAFTEETGHVFEKVETVVPTCTTYGYDLYECRCGLTEEREIVDALGHDFPAFDATNVSAAWTQTNEMTATDCPCTFVPEYAATCTRCPEPIAKTGVAAHPEHVYTQFYPAVPDATLSPCLQGTYEIAKCDYCNTADNVAEHGACANHAFYRQTSPAPGHTWSQWTVVGAAPTENSSANITRSCTRAGCGMTEDAVLPALSEANGWTLNVKEPSCVDTGLKTYTMTKDGTKFTYTVVIDTEGGHKVNSATPVVVAPTTTTKGSVTVVCPDCEETLTFELPVIPTAEAYKNGATGGYTIDRGTCADPTVTFKLVITDNDFYPGHSIIAEFSITDQAYHPHAVSANIADCIIAKDENGVESYFALCQNSDGCHQWIYVGPVED